VAARQLEIEFDKKLREKLQRELTCSSSLTSDFKSVALRRIEYEGDASMRFYFDLLIGLVGDKQPDEWRAAYLNTIQYLERSKLNNNKCRSDTTVNRYKSVFRMIFNYARDERIIKEMSVNIRLSAESGRDRVWNSAERDRIFSVLRQRNSWLLMPVYFSSFNPIRVGDLFNLERESWRPIENWVEFYASKTTTKKARNRRPTYLRQIDENIRDFFNCLPADCPYLFPRIYPDGSWRKVNCFRGYREYIKEWDIVLQLANVKDFHWHDLKHCAITYLMDNGYSELDLRNCGIQYTSTDTTILMQKKRLKFLVLRDRKPY